VSWASQTLFSSQRMLEGRRRPRALRKGADPNQSEPSTLSPKLAGQRLRRHVTATAAILFLLILSGPPRMPIRDPEASLRGEVDWVVVIHLLVWGLGGLWVLAQMARRFWEGRPLLRLQTPQILGLAMIVCLPRGRGGRGWGDCSSLRDEWILADRASAISSGADTGTSPSEQTPSTTGKLQDHCAKGPGICDDKKSGDWDKEWSARAH